MSPLRLTTTLEENIYKLYNVYNTDEKDIMVEENAFIKMHFQIE
jgi:hypothetical protein